MRYGTPLVEARIVRLNAEQHPVTAYEAEQYARFGLTPKLVEARTPAEIIPHVAEADAVFAVSVSLPAAVIDAMARCRVISRMGTGTDKIDVAKATDARDPGHQRPLLLRRRAGGSRHGHAAGAGAQAAADAQGIGGGDVPLCPRTDAHQPAAARAGAGTGGVWQLGAGDGPAGAGLRHAGDRYKAQPGRGAGRGCGNRGRTHRPRRRWSPKATTYRCTCR